MCIRDRIGSAKLVEEEKRDNRTSVYIKKDDALLGAYIFSNSYRKGLKDLFNKLSTQQSIHILSGDNDAEKPTLEKIAPPGTTFCFNQSPADKLAYIAALQQKGEKVMMLGDGLNDAGALKQSNVGISVVDDVYAFSPASDAILSGKKLTQLTDFLNFANFSKRVVKWSYAFSLLYNTVGLCFALTGSLTPLVAAILMPLSSITVVLFVTLLTNTYKLK